MSHANITVDTVDPAVGAICSSGQLRALYETESDLSRRRVARQGLWIAVPTHILFLFADLALIPDVAPEAIFSRLAIGGAVLVLLEILIHKSVRTIWIDALCAAAIVLGYVFWLIPALSTQYTESLSYYMIFGAIFMMGGNLFFSFEFRLSLITSGIVFLSFLFSFTLFNPSGPYWFAYSLFYLSCFAFTSFVNWRLNCERFNVFVNALEARKQHQEATEKGEALLHLSRTDPLTGLDNRRALDGRLHEYWHDWQRYGVAFAVILVDIDFFKRYNDAYGHQEGDHCLYLVAKVLQETIKRWNATVSRYGGEEFLILARMSSDEEVSQLAEELRTAVATLGIRHEERRDGMSVVTVSLGAALSRGQSGAKIEKVIHQADRALYSAKASGRNIFRLFDPDDPHANDVCENIAALLKVATVQNLVSLVYQPIQNTATGEFEAVEALMRLKMSDGTSVPPSLFIPVAERTGAIMELGRWAVRTACNELLVDNCVPLISVNVSPVQLRSPGFAASIALILQETGVSGRRLALEVTEGLEMEMHSDVIRCISDLKLLGVEIWLDDFGTGFAGLSWLRLIDFDTVKIDRSFLHDCTSAKGKSMLRDIIGLVRNRVQKVLVEGVETEAQLELMRAFQVDQVQGYYIGRPATSGSYRRELPKPLRRAQSAA
jgi:diguanylate cyclase (GGDEF)-like protein